MNKYLKYAFFVIVGIFALIGVFFTAVFIAMQFGWLNVRGAAAARDQFFTSASATSLAAAAVTTAAIPLSDKSSFCVASDAKTCTWNETREWTVVKNGLIKDEPIIARVSAETGVSKRMIASVVVPEQIRLFTSDREVFKRYFEPMKILGTMIQFSLGVSGIKQETAKDIERYASDTSSYFYPGAGAAELLAYKSNPEKPNSTNHDDELLNRLTDTKNHYYSYLYTALYIKEVEAQWKLSGFDISQKPEAVVTLFNIGYKKSQPHADPLAGGAGITLGGKAYPYGALGAMFYYSNELTDLFAK